MSDIYVFVRYAYDVGNRGLRLLVISPIYDIICDEGAKALSELGGMKWQSLQTKPR